MLPQSFYNCNNLNIFFNGNFALKSNKQIPNFYSETYNVYIKHLKKNPSNIIQILNQSLWFNAFISSNTDITFIGNWSIKGINQIKDVIDKNAIFMTHSQLIQKYDITTRFLKTLQLLTSIP